MAKINLQILTPEKEIFSADVDMVTAETSEGQIGILPHHVALTTKLVPGELMVKQGEKTTPMAVGGGILQISDNKLTILTDLAQKAEEIEEKVVEEAKKRAEVALEQTLSDEEYAETLATLEKSLVQLKVKRRYRVH